MALYETTFIARQDISTQDVEKLTQNFSNVIAQNGGKVVKTEYWGLRSLAYIIKKNRKGHYVMLGVDAPFAAVQELERLMGYNEDVLRSLTIRVNTIEEEPSPMMSNRGNADDSQDQLSSNANDNSDNEE